MNNRTVLQMMLLVIGAVVLLGGLVCVVAGFASLGGSDGSLALFAAGGFAMVIGVGLVASARDRGRGPRRR